MDEIISTYEPPVSQLLTLGDPRNRVRRVDYLALGLTADHVPELVRMIQDNDLHLADGESNEVWAPLHAWRALGQLQAEAAIEPLVALLNRIDEDDDDWVMEELPEILAQVGAAAGPGVIGFLANPENGLWARVTAATSLAKIGQAQPAARPAAIAALTEQLSHFESQDDSLNGFIVSALLDLKAVEAAPAMEQAFQANKVDISIQGDWEDVQISLGLLEQRLTPQPHYVWMTDSEARQEQERLAQFKAEQRNLRQAKSKAKAKRKQAKKTRQQQRKKKK